MEQAKGFMVGEPDNGLESENSNSVDDNETKASKVEIRDN
jgi:hypothetical protein